jgi:hypothetical protein
VLSVELLEGVVGEHERFGAKGHLQQESVTASDSAGRRRYELAVSLGLVEGIFLCGIDAMAEGGVDDHDDLVAGHLLLELADGVVELGQAGGGAAFCGDVRAVDDDAVSFHGWK